MEQTAPGKGISVAKVVGIVVAAMLVTMVATVLVIKWWLFPQPFQPVVLSSPEQQQLERKLARLENPWQKKTAAASSASSTKPDTDQQAPKNSAGTSPAALQPEPYSETGAAREIRLTEREINAMIAHNTDLASKVAVDLADNLISAKVLIPLDPDFPFVGGKTMRVRAGVELAFRDGRPVVIVRGLSIMGVPMPNAWLGGLKNIDLIKNYGNEQGFWKGFADGVASMEVKNDQLLIILKE